MKIKLLVDWAVPSIFWFDNGVPLEYDEVKDLLNDPNNLEKIKKISEDIIKVFYVGNHLLVDDFGDEDEGTQSFCDELLIAFAKKYYKYFKEDVDFYCINYNGVLKPINRSS